MATHTHLILPVGGVTVIALLLAAAIGLSIAAVKVRLPVVKVLSLAGAVGFWWMIATVVFQILKVGIPNSISIGH